MRDCDGLASRQRGLSGRLRSLGVGVLDPMQPDYQQAAAIVREALPRSPDPEAFAALALVARLCESMAAGELVERTVDAEHCPDCTVWREAAKQAGARSEFQCPKHWPRTALDLTDNEWQHCEQVAQFTSDWTCADVHVVLLRERADLCGRLEALQAQHDALVSATKAAVEEWRELGRLEKRVADATSDVGCRAAWSTYECCADEIVTLIRALVP